MLNRLSTSRNTAVDARQARWLPRPQVQTMMVRQPVSLKPMGNTIALTVPAEMPFVGQGGFSVQTQMSGGMAGPDPSMQSRRLRGCVPFAGLGGLPRATVSRAAAERIVSGDQSQYSPGLWNEATAVVDGTMLALDDSAAPASAPAADSGFSWSKAGDIFSTMIPGGANVYGQIKAAMKKPGGVTNITNYAPAAKSSMTPILIVAGVGLVGLLAFLMLRKKGAAAPA